MSKETTTSNGIGLAGDLSVIRSILVGEQMSSVEQRLLQKDEEIKELKAHIEANHTQFTATTEHLKANFEESMRKMELLHSKDKDMLSKKIEDAVVATKHSFGQVLTELGKIMMK